MSIVTIVGNAFAVAVIATATLQVSQTMKGGRMKH